MKGQRQAQVSVPSCSDSTQETGNAEMELNSVPPGLHQPTCPRDERNPLSPGGTEFSSFQASLFLSYEALSRRGPCSAVSQPLRYSVPAGACFRCLYFHSRTAPSACLPAPPCLSPFLLRHLFFSVASVTYSDISSLPVLIYLF